MFLEQDAERLRYEYAWSVAHQAGLRWYLAHDDQTETVKVVLADGLLEHETWVEGRKIPSVGVDMSAEKVVED